MDVDDPPLHCQMDIDECCLLDREYREPMDWELTFSLPTHWRREFSLQRLRVGGRHATDCAASIGAIRKYPAEVGYL